MRILFFNHSASPTGGGMNQYVLDVIARLRAANETVALVHSREPHSEYGGTGYILDGLQSSKTDIPFFQQRLEAILEDFQPDIVQLHGVWNPWLDEILPQLCPTVRFIHNHEFYCSGGNMTTVRPFRPCECAHAFHCLIAHRLQGCGSYNPWHDLSQHRRVTQRLKNLQHLHGIQVATQTLAQNLRRNGVPESKITLLPLYAAEPRPGIPDPDPQRRTLLHVGGLLRKKGIWLMIRMLRSLPNDVEIVFAGAGPEQTTLERHVRARGLSNRIRILGDPLPDQWYQLYSTATLIILPNLWNEPLGFCALQALAYGKVVVTFRVGGTSEWIDDGFNGITIPFGETHQFQEAVLQLLTDSEKLRTMGKNAKKIWENRFHPDKHLARLRAFYLALVSKSVPN
ncbi:MAG: hypothetical protein C5B47_04470 [Verrucomicrobia bacterium]|nr:MAG: hypothetical protein C5B47_04470 [Verrucomicrobiota bacterium]